jgi:hypothetical protein
MDVESLPSHWRAVASALSQATKPNAFVLSVVSLSRMIVIARLDDLDSCAVKAWVWRTGQRHCPHKPRLFAAGIAERRSCRSDRAMRSRPDSLRALPRGYQRHEFETQSGAGESA